MTAVPVGPASIGRIASNTSSMLALVRMGSVVVVDISRSGRRGPIFRVTWKKCYKTQDFFHLLGLSSTEQKTSKWQMQCPDHGSLVALGREHEQKYKAESEMWAHHDVGHVHAKVVEVK